MPFARHIAPTCEQGLSELERRGYAVWRVGGYAAIDQGRNQMATDALAAGFEEPFWIDSDIEFHPNAVDQLRSCGLPIASGVYAAKAVRGLGSQALPGTARLVVGKGGGLCEVLYAGAGFLHVRREVYRTIQERLALPTCNVHFGKPMIPFFQPMVHVSEAGPWYLAEDYAFCQRARECGYKIMADTSIRLWHIGEYAYGWEDAGLNRVRLDSLVLVVTDGKKVATPCAHTHD